MVTEMIHPCRRCTFKNGHHWYELSTERKAELRKEMERDKKLKREWQKHYDRHLSREKDHVRKDLQTDPKIPFSTAPAPMNDEEYPLLIRDCYVSDLATMRLKQFGITQFWITDKEKKLERDYVARGQEGKIIQPYPEFHSKYLSNSATHRVPRKWTVTLRSTLMGFLPITLLAALLNDFKSTENVHKKWRSIVSGSSNITYVEGKTDGGRYRWLTPISHASGNSRTYMSEQTENLLPHFLRVFLEKALFIPKEEWDAWSVFAGLVFTPGEPGTQWAHQDFAEMYHKDTWLVHIPLQREGSVISIWDPNLREHRYVHIPFGTYFAIRADVWHSGFYGNRGNVRFHVIISKHNLPKKDRLRTVCDKQLQADLNSARPDCYRSFLEVHSLHSTEFVSFIEEVLHQRSPAVIDSCSLDNLPSTINLLASGKGAANQCALPIRIRDAERGAKTDAAGHSETTIRRKRKRNIAPQVEDGCI